jgi:glycosyltransferase involved in cell wall biosynthesis
MKLAWITPRFAPEGIVGGAETLIRDLAMIAVEAGHEVHLLTTCARDHYSWANEREPGEEVVEGLQVHYFSVNEDRDVERFLAIQGRMDRGREISREEENVWVANSVCSRSLNAWLEEKAPGLDAVMAGPYLFGITVEASRICPEKFWLVPCLHDEAFARLQVVAEMFRSVKGCLFNAEPEKQLAERLYGADAVRGAVVGMALESFASDGEAFRRKFGVKKPYVLYCGRREEGKNTHLLFDYLNTYVERRDGAIQVVLAGSGELQPPEKLRPHVVDAGFLSAEDKRNAMAGAEVFIHPSTNESFGIVLLEAWLAGTPVLVHDRGEVLRWQCQESGGGLWFRYYPEFEAMLDRLLEDKALNRALAENGKRFVEETYTRSAISTRLFNALQS